MYRNFHPATLSSLPQTKDLLVARVAQAMVIVETQRLLLRKFQLFDADTIACVFGDPEVMRYGDGVKNREEVILWLEQRLENYRNKSGLGPWAVVRKGSGELIGYCGLFYFPDVCGQPETEVGYRLGRHHWGFGYATESAIAVRDFAFDVLGQRRLIAIIDPQNIASLRVAEKLGMQYEKEVMLEGWTHADSVYSMENSTQRPRG